MKFKMIHENYNVRDLDQSLKFYAEALGLHELHRIEAEDGSYRIVYVGNEETDFELELTWLRDHLGPYDLGRRNSIWLSVPTISRRLIKTPGNGLHLPGKSPDGDLFHPGPGRLLAGDCTGAIQMTGGD